MRFPTVHLNGTGGVTLFDEYYGAYKSLDTAIEALQKVTVHGRDYYVQEGNAFEEARSEHIERLKALEKVKKELNEILVHLNDQLD